MLSLREKNRRVGLGLAVMVMALAVYSLIVIKTRGHLTEPANLTKAQKIFRGL